MLAGSFTGYLIARFGWDAYRSFACQVTRRTYVRLFETVFGVPLLEVEQNWRQDLAIKSEQYVAFAVAETRLHSLLNRGRVNECLRKCAAMRQAGVQSATVIVVEAMADRIQRSEAKALECLNEVLTRTSPILQWFSNEREAVGYLQLGMVYDLLSERTSAVDAYKKVLGLSVPFGVAQRRARAFLKDPFRQLNGQLGVQGNREGHAGDYWSPGLH